MKIVTAIVRTTTLDRIVKAFEDIGIKGMTLSDVKGIGEQVEVFQLYVIHKRIDIIVPDERVNEVTSVIVENGHTGFAGDGLIAVHPIDYMIKIRTKEKIE
ncbi:MAG: P-II family nitrogen regulator [Nitrospirota bacterium]